MSLRWLALLCLSVACSHRQPVGPEPEVFSLGRDFSFSANPNGPWRYGYTRGQRLSPSEFVIDAKTSVSGEVGFWQPGPGHFPYVSANLGAGTGHYGPAHNNSWVIRPGEIAMEASEVGQFAVVEFVIPRDGTYAIVADFAGIHTGLSTTDAHVLLDEQTLWSAIIDGYGGDPGYFPRRGNSPSATFNERRPLKAGAVLMFAIGAGANHTHFYDTTGAIVTITRLP